MLTTGVKEAPEGYRAGLPTPPQEVGETGIEEIRPAISNASRERVNGISELVGRRVNIPVRKLFVRRREEDGKPTGAKPPLAQLVSTQGRGGAVALKLYLAMLWLGVKDPHDIKDVSARQWAEVLDLPDPAHKGARRITSAIGKLEALGLIDVTRSRGEAPAVRLLNEAGKGHAGSGAAYTLPSTAYQMAKKNQKAQHLYFKVPVALWETGHIQSMSAGALAMLLIIAAEAPYADSTDDVWWSTHSFPERYGISSNMRAAGTKELIARRLILVKKEIVPDNPTRSVGREKVRNRYRRINEALPAKED